MATVIHLVDSDLARGAQRGAQMLVDSLRHCSTDDHVIASIFDAPRASLEPHIELRAPNGPARSRGLSASAIWRMRRSSDLRRADLVV
ncbi:MAG: glycosyltransferase, partial [Acidimicrobiales bacterium]